VSTDPSPARPSHAEADVDADGDGLVSRLRVIEDQPLEARADAYIALHAELKAVLDSADRTSADRTSVDRTSADRTSADRTSVDRTATDGPGAGRAAG
jgi:hypothetical protein